MTFTSVTTIEVALADDGTYRLQSFRDRDGERVPVPVDSTAGHESIPDGLRALADHMEVEGRRAFAR